MPFWKPTPKITVAEHERIVADVHDAKEIYQREMDKYRDLYLEVRSECATETRRANALAAELAHWKKYGQLRYPATGRRIPKNAGKTPVGGE